MPEQHMTQQPTHLVVTPGERVTGQRRERLAAQVREQYDSGMSVRQIAAASGRSYGSVHRILAETATSMRRRGGTRAV